jgi:hypothetical protein
MGPRDVPNLPVSQSSLQGVPPVYIRLSNEVTDPQVRSVRCDRTVGGFGPKLLSCYSTDGASGGHRMLP